MTTATTEHRCPEHNDCHPDECMELLHWLDKCPVCGETMTPDNHFAPGICEPREEE